MNLQVILCGKKVLPVMAGLPIVLFMASCQLFTLEGEWDGRMDCGSGTVPVNLEFELEESGQRSYEGSGNFNFTSSDYWQYDFELEIEHDAFRTGDDTADLDMEMLNCTEIDLGAVGFCPTLMAEWDLGDSIQGELSDFFAIDDVPITCHFDVD